MTPLCQTRKSDGRWFVRAFALLMIGVPAVAQQAIMSAPLSANEVMGRVAQMNAVRAKALESYSSVRSYHLECHCVSHKKADMVVRTDYQAPNKKEFTILSESGSGTVRDRVFKKLLEAELESMQDENQQRSAITPENYTFQVSYYEKTDTDEFYVLDAQPRSKNKFLFRGHIWVNAKDLAITRVEGEPAVSPSWWTVKTDFKRRYQNIGDFWLPESNESETKVRVFGTAVLSIDYRDYQIKQDGGRTVASPPSEVSAATVSKRATQTQPKFANSAPLFLRCALRFQELAQERRHEIRGQDVIDAAFERVPPEFRRTGSSHKDNWSRDINGLDPFDQISPIAINQGELRDNHGLLARQVEQINCRPDAARPLHNQSVCFNVLCDRGFRALIGHENHCSCLSVGLHRFSNAAA